MTEILAQDAGPILERASPAAAGFIHWLGVHPPDGSVTGSGIAPAPAS